MHQNGGGDVEILLPRHLRADQRTIFRSSSLTWFLGICSLIETGAWVKTVLYSLSAADDACGAIRHERQSLQRNTRFAKRGHRESDLAENYYDTDHHQSLMLVFEHENIVAAHAAYCEGGIFRFIQEAATQRRKEGLKKKSAAAARQPARPATQTSITIASASQPIQRDGRSILMPQDGMALTLSSSGANDMIGGDATSSGPPYLRHTEPLNENKCRVEEPE